MDRAVAENGVPDPRMGAAKQVRPQHKVLGRGARLIVVGYTAGQISNWRAVGCPATVEIQASIHVVIVAIRQAVGIMIAGNGLFANEIGFTQSVGHILRTNRHLIRRGALGFNARISRGARVQCVIGPGDVQRDEQS